MKTAFYFFGLCIIGFCLCACNQQTKSTAGNVDTTAQFYTMDDFASVEKFDVHIHVNTVETTFMEQAKADNFKFLTIVDDRPFGLTMYEQQEIVDRHLKNFPALMDVATTFSVADWDTPEWLPNTLSYLDKQFAKGVRAVKVWKNIGMDLRDKNGAFVMLDDERLDPVFDHLAKNHIAVIGHNGEPRDCWLPLDSMTFSRGYYSEHPEYHMYLHPEYPSYQDQIDARDRMLAKHPDLAFIGAHLGSLEWSLDELSRRLDSYPNMLVDLSRMPYLQLHAKTDWEKTREFFINHQDRLVYGTDRGISDQQDTAAFKQGIHDGWLRDWKFYVTEEPITLRGHGELRGLHLPKGVVDKIYLKNAERWLTGKADS